MSEALHDTKENGNHIKLWKKVGRDSATPLQPWVAPI